MKSAQNSIPVQLDVHEHIRSAGENAQNATACAQQAMFRVPGVQQSLARFQIHWERGGQEEALPSTERMEALTCLLEAQSLIVTMQGLVHEALQHIHQSEQARMVVAQTMADVREKAPRLFGSA